MKKRFAIIIAFLLSFSIPSGAVFNEKDLGQTISVLRFELQREYRKMEGSKDMINNMSDSQHDRMVKMLKRCNELSLMLYSQNQDYTFDLTYALDEVTKQYEEFQSDCLPFDNIVTHLDQEIDRYEHLLESLRRIPPVIYDIQEIPDSLKENGPLIAFRLDSLGCIDRDSCVFYSAELLNRYKQQKEMVERDSRHYSDMSDKLKTSYDYAQNRYSQIRHDIFVEGQDNYFNVLCNLPYYINKALADCNQKYARTQVESAWRGPVVVAFMVFVIFFLMIATVLSNLFVWMFKKRIKGYGTEDFRQRRRVITLLAGSLIFAVSVMAASGFIQQNFIHEAASQTIVFAWLLVVTFASLLVRLESGKLQAALKLRIPVLVLGLIVIIFRVVFIPNSLLNLIYPLLLLLFAIWQHMVCKHHKGKKNDLDLTFGRISLFVIVAAMVVAWIGYVLLAVQVFMWWMFQIAIAYTLLALYDLVGVYEEKIIVKRIKQYKEENEIYGTRKDGAYIAITWLHDLLSTAVAPVLAIASIPLSVWLAADMFDLTQVCKDAFVTNFLSLTDKDGATFLSFSCFKIAVVAAMFFIFKYLAYAIKAFYRLSKMHKMERENGGVHVRANDVNLTLINKVISILVWGTFIVFTIVLLKIPVGALSIVAAGLATGIGLALKDVLNNFIYGIQLMSGRLRVGDYIECDGFRGKVVKISYQSTQVETIEGAVVSFTNSTLFNKNFKNLTRNNAYEFVTVDVGVAYGSSVEEVRKILLDAMNEAFGSKKDAFGRNLIEKKHGIWMHFAGFGDSSVDLTVKQYVLVEEKSAYLAAAREVIYNALNAHGIEIPFPQCDVHMDAPSAK